MRKFEYKLLDVVRRGWWSGKINQQELEDKLNEPGREGLEVAACSDIIRYQGGSRSVIIIMKRLLNDN